ncbi:MAG: FlgD immunoglobulin-like domain containing protein [Fidelibacterota bacterium]
MKKILLILFIGFSLAGAQTVDYDAQIQPIWNNNCTQCHPGSGGLDLTTGNSFGNLVDVSAQGYSALRVASGDPSGSVLWNKINNTGVYGGQMPPGGMLSQTDRDLVETWITELASGTTIYDIQYTADASGDSPLDGQVVTVTAIVTAEFWGSGNKHMFIQDAPGPWNGVMCYQSSGWDTFSFVDDAGNPVSSVAEGDSITITATVTEYYGMTELVDATDVVVHGPAMTPIPPAVVTPGEVGTGGTDEEAYEGCLVEVQSVSVDDPDLGFGEWSVTDGTNSVRLDDRWDYYYAPQMGHSLAKVVGCMDYSFSNRKIQPRLARDVVEAGNTRIQRIQQVLYSDLLTAGSDSQSDTSYMQGQTVTVVGVVTMPTGLSYAGSGIKFIFQDTSGGPWSSILSYDPDSTAFPVLYEGDLIEATGFVSEYSTGPSNMTELFITEPINILDFGLTPPTPPLVNTGDLRWPTEAEQWGNVSVRVEEAIVIQNDLPYGEWSIDDGTGTVNVDDDSDSLNVWQNEFGRPPVGSFISSIEGWIYHHYGSYSDSTAYKLEPLYPSDIVFGAGPPNIMNPARTPCVPGTADAVTIEVDIEDNSTVASAEISYSVDGGAYQSVAMTNTSGLTWSGDIPATGTEGARVNYFISATDDGTGQSAPKTSVLPYDTTAFQFGYVTKDGPLTIADIQYTTWDLADSPFNGCEVTVSGIVTADTAQAYSGYGAYALQSGTGSWNGIIFDPVDGVELTRGDSVTVTGTVEEYDPVWHFKYDNNTKLIDITNVTVHSSGHNVDPMPVGTADLAQDADEVESYEGTLVTLANVTVSSVNQYDWSVDDGSGVTCLIDDDMANAAADGFMNTLEVGTTLASVTGVFNFSYGSYKIQIRDLADLGQLGVNDDYVVQPMTYALHQNYPNPFNPETKIRFDLGSAENVKLVIYDINGRVIRTLVNESFSPGMHLVNWNGTNDFGEPVSTGMYIYRIKAGSFLAQEKMLLVR